MNPSKVRKRGGSKTGKDLLPVEFRKLGSLADKWAHSSFEARYRARLSSTMPEIQSFYDAMLPRMEKIVAYLNRFRPGEMPLEAERLFHLGLAFMDVSPAVELYHQRSVPQGFEADRVRVLEP